MVINLKQKTKREAYLLYLNLLNKFHKLTDKEVDILMELLRAYFSALKKYNNEEAASKLYFNKEDLSKKTKIKPSILKNYLSSLRKKKVLLEDNRISPVLVPKSINGVIEVTFKIKFDG